MKAELNFKSLFFLALMQVSLLSSCSNEDVIPPGIIPQDSMIVILTDVHLAESRIMLQGKYAGDEQFKASYIHHVLDGLKIDTARFNHSFNYYTSKPEVFTVMYDKVMAEISRRQAEKK